MIYPVDSVIHLSNKLWGVAHCHAILQSHAYVTLSSDEKKHLIVGYITLTFEGRDEVIVITNTNFPLKEANIW